MRVRMTRRTGVAGLAAVVALLVGATPASASPGDASAFGVDVAVTLLGQAAVQVGPLAVADSDGPTSASVASVDQPGVLRTGVVTASASRDDQSGAVTASASTVDAEVGVLGPVVGDVTASVIAAECTATQQGITGKSTLTDVDLGSLGPVDANAAPNTTIDVKVLNVVVGKLVLNEQVTNTDGSLTVNALHLTLLADVLGALGTGDVVISSATCGPAALPIPMASGTGLWLGLGMLALFAVPAALITLRPRRAEAV
ncbi:choice-of-anchor P family protein [Saccharothrix violaceirubra]|uniref:LPXTG-motif cell wall-anchored protein n=1 Tax=Saccharothrix violaceirubra TaxID=413306 RepID=A0A7W7TAA6_9PSEU|nr:choice-of-anchor P family protein [Saccharothrix violaceirubra]MBB4968130.1 hypothetical protein [Saccharothrix violaceirubra]